MAGPLTIDSEWLMDQFLKLNEKVGVLPAIEEHLKTQNGTIQETVKACTKNTRIVLRNARRVKLLEDVAKAATAKRDANWARLIGSGLKIVEGVVLAFLLMRVLGWV